MPSGRARRAALTGALLVVWLAAGTSCTGAVPRPTFVSHPTSALVKVPFPPPPARVEYMPEQPRDDAVWIDGEWSWQGRTWAWIYGRWVVPPTGARYSPWTSVRDRRATLWFASGTWRDSAGRGMVAPKALATGRADETDVPEDEGNLEDTGNNQQPPPPSQVPPPAGAPAASGSAPAVSVPPPALPSSPSPSSSSSASPSSSAPPAPPSSAAPPQSPQAPR